MIDPIGQDHHHSFHLAKYPRNPRQQIDLRQFLVVYVHRIHLELDNIYNYPIEPMVLHIFLVVGTVYIDQVWDASNQFQDHI